MGDATANNRYSYRREVKPRSNLAARLKTWRETMEKASNRNKGTFFHKPGSQKA